MITISSNSKGTSLMTNPNAALRFAIIGATMATSKVISLLVRHAICNGNRGCGSIDHVILPQG